MCVPTAARCSSSFTGKPNHNLCHFWVSLIWKFHWGCSSKKSHQHRRKSLRFGHIFAWGLKGFWYDLGKQRSASELEKLLAEKESGALKQETGSEAPCKAQIRIGIEATLTLTSVCLCRCSQGRKEKKQPGPGDTFLVEVGTCWDTRWADFTGHHENQWESHHDHAKKWFRRRRSCWPLLVSYHLFWPLLRPLPSQMLWVPSWTWWSIPVWCRCC